MDANLHGGSSWFNNLSVHLFRWYSGKIKRNEAEKKLLTPQNKDGAFLIRDSKSQNRNFALSVKDGDKIKHIK